MILSDARRPHAHLALLEVELQHVLVGIRLLEARQDIELHLVHHAVTQRVKDVRQNRFRLQQCLEVIAQVRRHRDGMRRTLVDVLLNNLPGHGFAVLRRLDGLVVGHLQPEEQVLDGVLSDAKLLVELEVDGIHEDLLERQLALDAAASRRHNRPLRECAQAQQEARDQAL